MLKFTLFVILIPFISGNQNTMTYEQYTVFRLTPTTDDHMRILQNYELAGIHAFWRSPTTKSQTVELMVGHEAIDSATRQWNATKMKYVTLIPNVQTLIDQESPGSHNQAAFGWTKYHTVDEIYHWLDNMTKTHSKSNISIVVAGKSFEGQEIKGIRISHGTGKPGVVIEGGIHGSDRLSPATVTYVLNELISSRNPEVRKIAESFDWFIFPIVNPDGYQFSYSTARFWRKTRSTHPNCLGTDMNSNWNYKWDDSKGSRNPCSDTFRGNSAFSESETKSLSNYLKGLVGRISAYFSIHGYSQSLVYPCEVTPRQLGNCKEMKSISQNAMDIVSKTHTTKYITGSTEDLRPLETASSIEWVKNVLKLPVVYNYQFPDSKYGLLTPANLTIPYGRELLDVLMAVLTEARKHNLIITYKINK